MLYTSSNAPRDRDVWAFAYSTNNTEKSMALKKKPVLGRVVGTGWGAKFYEYKRNGELKKTCVSASARDYADTEQEAIETYNQHVNFQIGRLQDLINQCVEDLI